MEIKKKIINKKYLYRNFMKFIIIINKNYKILYHSKIYKNFSIVNSKF